MKMLQKLQKRLQNGKKDNKGFSLVELIIVIAIMAILVGIVGTQVIPYLNKSREAKDVQILDAISTAAVSAYSYNAESSEFYNASGALLSDVTVDLADKATDTTTVSDWLQDIYDLTSYKKFGDIKGAMTSTAGKTVASIEVKIDFTTNTLTVTAYDASSDEILEEVESKL